jgi:crotonobetainyl-CoA:carnitine CoA-transferase CaiB-like acyl-CoA transferase
MTDARPLPDGPLTGVRVLDLSRILAGPTCTQLLGDLGADVIKIERPGAGDDTRGWGPPFLRDADGRETRESAYYLCANRNKRSVAIDLSTPQGAAAVRRLAARADVLVENFKVGDLARRGLGWDDLRETAPRLVYCSITGFGQDGPEAGRAGYDALAQAMGGLMSVTGQPDGPPTKAGVGIADVMTGMYATVAILAALRAREATGRGQRIDVALFDTQLSWLINLGVAHLMDGRVPGRLGNAHPQIAPYDVFPTADGWMYLAVGNDAQFARFCAAAGRADLAADPDFAANADRVRNRPRLTETLRPLTAARPRAWWLAELARLGVPCGPVNDLAQAFAEPQAVHRGARVAMPHPVAGEVALIGNPLKFSDTPVTYRRAPPALGEHGPEALREAGFHEDEIAALIGGD